MNKETNSTEKEFSKMLEDFTKDRGELANSPLPGKIPAWWLIEGTSEEVAGWQRQLDSGEATFDR